MYIVYIYIYLYIYIEGFLDGFGWLFKIKSWGSDNDTSHHPYNCETSGFSALDRYSKAIDMGSWNWSRPSLKLSAAPDGPNKSNSSSQKQN
jgi:hypothetical protein